MFFHEEEITRRRSLRGYLHALREERRKILVFRRELPISLDLVTRVIESYTLHQDDDDDEEPLPQQFVPTNAPEEEEEEDQRQKRIPEWFRGSQRPPPPPPSPPPGEDPNLANPVAVEGTGFGPAGEGLGQRKARRCWSAELHQRFLRALHQLGGSQVATPKQIREMMRVDGLTNDEVKSHLQKYRLHSKRSPPEQAPPSKTNVGTQQQNLFLDAFWSSPTDPDELCASPSNRKKQKMTTYPEDVSVDGGCRNSQSSATISSQSSLACRLV